MLLRTTPSCTSWVNWETTTCSLFVDWEASLGTRRPSRRGPDQHRVPGHGISKAKGFIKAQRLANPDSRDPVVVMLGDGELNEGQIWESMPGAIKEGFSELIAIVDANQIQSDTWTEDTLPMGDLRKRVEGSGWIYLECDGQDPDQVLEVLRQAQQSSSPSFIVASTTKGAGVPWMESFPQAGEYYKFHSGALAQSSMRSRGILTSLVTRESADRRISTRRVLNLMRYLRKIGLNLC